MPGGFTYNGTHSDTMGITVTGLERGILPPVSLFSMDIPGKHGVYHTGYKFEPRVFTFEVIFKSPSTLQLWDKVELLAAWLNPDGGPKALTFDDWPGKTLYAIVNDDTDLEQIARLGLGEIEMVCPDPFAYGEPVQGNFVSSLANITNNGTTVAFPKFNITMNSSAGEIKAALGSTASSVFVRLVHSLVAGDVVHIDCAKGLVTLNGVRAMDKLDWQNTQFFTLATGVNKVYIVPSGVSSATYEFSPTYL